MKAQRVTQTKAITSYIQKKPADFEKGNNKYRMTFSYTKCKVKY